MCGIQAALTRVAIGFTQQEVKSFKQTMYLTQIRGKHSTGLGGFVPNSETPDVIKAVGAVQNIMDYAQTDVFFDRMFRKYNMVMGHCRHATMGAKSAENAHPFTEGHITLIHNGVIRNFKELQTEKYKDIPIDSQLIARLISDDGVEKTLPRIRGAFAFIWYNHKDKTFNVARNTERPLALAKSTNSLFFISEIESAEWDAKRNGVAYTSIEEVAPFIIYTYKDGELTCTETPFEGPKPEVVSYSNGYSAPRSRKASTPAFTTNSIKVLDASTHHKIALAVDDAVHMAIQDVMYSKFLLTALGEVPRYQNVMFKMVVAKGHELLKGAKEFNILEDELLLCDSVRGKVVHLRAADEVLYPEERGYNWVALLDSRSISITRRVKDVANA